jgi:geranylgeranyl pyrophosphate synthase
VECFHKASLVHDDIEDDDPLRYGRATMHVEHGVPIALNTGDLLIGEGYRLLAECGAPLELRGKMLSIASRAHRELCLGQGEELAWTRRPRPLEVSEVLGIFRRKTAPAFEVALVLGAVAAGADEEVCAVLRDLSAALGTAYQIRDDLDDHRDGGDVACLRPSLFLALALERAGAEERRALESALERRAATELEPLVEAIVRRAGLRERARERVEELEEQATRALRPLSDTRLKCLLLRLVHKVLGHRTAAPLNPHR